MIAARVPPAPALHGSRYPWPLWFHAASMSPLRLRWGRDYRCRTDSMRQVVKQAAKRYGIRVSTAISKDAKTLTIRTVTV